MSTTRRHQDVPEVARWQVRWSPSPNPTAPRETLAVTVKLGRSMVWRASCQDLRGHRHGGEGHSPCEAVARLVGNLVGYRGMVWAVAPPGVTIAADTAPERSPREPGTQHDLQRYAQQVQGHDIPAAVDTLVRKAHLAGCAVQVTTCHGGGATWVQIGVRGVAGKTLATELRAAGFVRRGSAPRWMWAPAWLARGGAR